MDEQGNSFVFDIEDDYEKCCGEIYLNNKGSMIFHCTLCKAKFDGFEKYVEHVEHIHKPELFACSLKEDFIGIPELNWSDEDFQSIELNSQINNNECIAISRCKTEPEKVDICEKEGYMTNNTKAIFKKKFMSKKKLTPKATIATVAIEHNFDSEKESGETKEKVNKESEHIKIRSIRKYTNTLTSKNDLRPFQCSYCDAAFKDANRLDEHIARHRTEKLHPCPECSKMFYTKTDMRKHLKFHAGARPFLCDFCGRTFISNVKLRDHKRRHTEQRDFECLDCGKRFYTSKLLKDHSFAHKDEKPFGCTLCDAKFKYKKGLQNHNKLHENKRAYKCDICEAEFNQHAGLFCHKKSKHQLEPFN